MVTTGQVMGYVMAIALPLIAGLIPFYVFWRCSSKIERGMLGAMGYGMAGYFWQQIIYGFLGLLAITNLKDGLNATGGNAVFVAFVEALASSLFVAVGLYWGIYLTNTKQRSLYRSATVGIGFGLGAAILEYGFSLYHAVQINMGIFTGHDSEKMRILTTSTVSLYVDAYRNILFVMIYMGVALLIGKYYLEKNRVASWATPILVYMLMRFTDVLLNTYVPLVAAKSIYLVVLTLLAAASLWMVVQWMKKGNVELGQRKK